MLSKTTYKDVPTRVEHVDKNKSVTRIHLTAEWTRIVAKIGKHIKAGGEVRMETRKVRINRSRGTVVEVADVELLP